MKKFNVWMKDRKNDVVDGVISGLANYIGWDVTILRILFIIGLFVTGFTAVFIYFLLSWFVVPDYNSANDLTLNPKKENKVKKEEKVNSVIKNL